MDESQSPLASAKLPEEAPQRKTMPIHLLGSKLLRQPCLPVVDCKKVIDLAEVMVHTMFSVDGVGLAAPQVGVNYRLFVMVSPKENKVLKLANPFIDSQEGEQEIEEGCLSQPGLSVKMKRPKIVYVKAQNIETGEQVIVEGTDLEAAILCHEIDHLNGKLICDSISRLKRSMYAKKLAKKLKQHDRQIASRNAALSKS